MPGCTSAAPKRFPKSKNDDSLMAGNLRSFGRKTRGMRKKEQGESGRKTCQRFAVAAPDPENSVLAAGDHNVPVRGRGSAIQVISRARITLHVFGVLLHESELSITATGEKLPRHANKGNGRDFFAEAFNVFEPLAGRKIPELH